MDVPLNFVLSFFPIFSHLIFSYLFFSTFSFSFFLSFFWGRVGEYNADPDRRSHIRVRDTCVYMPSSRVSLENFQGSRVGYLRCKDLFTRLIFSSESRELTREISRNEDVTRRPIDYSSFIPNAWQLLNEHFRGYVNICAEFCVAICVPGKYSDVQSFKFAIRESVYTRMQVKSYSGG